MTDLRFDHLREINVARQGPDGFNHPLKLWSRDEWIVAVTGEFGEASNILKKLHRERDGITGNRAAASVLRDRFRLELGDAVIYADLFAASEGLGLAELSTFRQMLEGNEVRPYLHRAPAAHMATALRSFATCTAKLNSADWWKSQNEVMSISEREEAGDYLQGFVTSLAAAARHYAIDLGSAVVEAFNAKSDELQMPHRLVLS